MGGLANDISEQTQRIGSGSSLPLSVQNQLVAQKRQAENTFGSLDPTIDAEWANMFSGALPAHMSFDYYFTGQDIQCFIEGVEKPDKEADIPIAALAFDVEQQKVPVYGFWNYTFNAVMRGTRVISGIISIYTTSADYMTRMLSKAATVRAEGKTQFAIRGLDRDEKLIEQYWGRNKNNGISTYQDNKNIFNAHPPFNLIIMYGLQSNTLAANADTRTSQVLENYRQGQTPLMTDINERLVATHEENPMRIVLENCEIVKLHTEYQPDGAPLIETYSFFARDMIIPNLSNNAPNRANSV